MDTKIYTRISQDMKDKAVEKASEQGETLSTIIRMLLREWLEVK